MLTEEMKRNMKALSQNKRVYVLRNGVDTGAMINKKGIERAEAVPQTLRFLRQNR